MSKRVGVALLVLVALIAGGTALAHLSCIYFGPECYAAQMAPPVIVESAKVGGWLAPVGTVLVAGIFLVWALYGLSAAKLIPRLLWLTPVVYLIGALCVIRGLLPIQLWLRHPEKVSDPVMIVGLVWLASGLMYILGYRAVRKSREC